MIRKPGIMAVMIFALASATADALDIVFNDINTTTLFSAAEIAALNQAASLWEGAFADPITVVVNVGYGETDFVAEARSARGTFDYVKVRGRMFSDAGINAPSFTLTDEQLAINALPLGLTFATGLLEVITILGHSVKTELLLTTANAKALGLTPSADPVYGGQLPNNADVQIIFNEMKRSEFDIDRSDGIDSDKRDFIGIMIHEIGHGLGFRSGVDGQDLLPMSFLSPTTFDLWRFPDTGGAHDLGTETRLFTAGPAEYWDSVLNNVPLSHGLDVVDAACTLKDGICGAGHWSSSTMFLMDPGQSKGEFLTVAEADIHAIDFVGYNRGPTLNVGIKEALMKIGFFNYVPGQDPPGFINGFNAFESPPDADNVTPPFDADFAARIGLDFGPGFENRSAIGFVQFEDEHPNPSTDLIFPDPDDVVGEFNHDPPFDRVLTIPPAITAFYFESDATAGVEFTGSAAVSHLGAMFDPTIGPYGGYRISIDLDGMGDGEVGDIDANVTILLMAEAPGVPNPNLQNIFQTGLDPDNVIIIYDPQAFGIPEPSTFALAAIGLLSLGFYSRRRRRRV